MPTLDFKGKQFIYGHHLTVPVRTLQTDADKSLTNENDPSLNDNLIIHGDNLHALKALLPKYAGKIKCIYIDPPYNTGNENWVYNDNVNSPMMQAWLEKHSPVDVEDLERHDKWLCMMWPRLHLLKELLADDGVIFMSIDDNEIHHLRTLMDEVFGDNFRNIISVRRGVKNVQAQFQYVDRLNVGSEYILFFSKSSDMKFRHLTVDLNENKVGSWNNHWRGTDRPTMRYELMGITPEKGQWRWEKERSLAAIENYERLLDECGSTPSQAEIDEWWFSQSPQKPDLLRRSTTNQPEHFVPPSDRRIVSSLWTDLIVNESPSLVKTLEINFPNPKRTDLIKRIINYATISDENDIILDSFAGSGTTAHAVLALNKEDGGNRKFILIECEDYADTITAERVRRVINGVENATNENLRDGLGGSFTYCTLGEPIDEEGMLTGENLPAYEDLAHYIAYTATGSALTSIKKRKDYCFGETNAIRFYLIYEPTLAFLESSASALDGARAEQIAKACKESGKSAYVYAPQKFISQKELTSMGITFCQLPYNIHRIADA